jgi:hypothetical protein
MGAPREEEDGSLPSAVKLVDEVRAWRRDVAVVGGGDADGASVSLKDGREGAPEDGGHAEEEDCDGRLHCEG